MSRGVPAIELHHEAWVGIEILARFKETLERGRDDTSEFSFWPPYGAKGNLLYRWHRAR